MLFRGTHIKDLSKASIITILVGFVLLGSATYLFFSLAEEVLEREKFAIDQATTAFVNKITNPLINTIMGYVTEAGSVLFLTIGTIVVVGILFFFSKFSKCVPLFFIIDMVGISILTKVLKLLFERKRPDVLAKYDGTGFSFPSGHSTGAITFYGFLIYLVIISPMRSRWKWVINILIGLFAVSIAFSRVFLGVHYITDILAGLAFGLAWLLICIIGLELMLWRQRRRRYHQTIKERMENNSDIK
ncbi:phosphatase PAP2 family protein [Thalassobacillus pellis]|uniref:phosphatase PAP2 family protein n=1 Tax=Thalassobacillus pellis TaxID=748008 RepID=UPI001961E8A0|nr:phosphatase PAP2 family protein [Thalassobacillus pellis]MBM7553374.1 undecaprenyl-diphosphatase [Thalassobacillus pellis]